MLGKKSYKTAWYLCHRIRAAMAAAQDRPKLGGTIEVDETFVGGRNRGHQFKPGIRRVLNRSLLDSSTWGRWTTPLLSRFRCKSGTLAKYIRENVSKDVDVIMTDEFGDTLKPCMMPEYSILESKNLTLHSVSQRSAVLFGRSSPYFLQHNLYYDLRRGTFSPSLFQLFALSRISNYRLFDWMRVFGFDIEAIPRLQIRLSSARTILLDSSLDDPNSLVPWLHDSRAGLPPTSVIPFSQVLEWTSPRRLATFAALKDKGFLYARIGYQDALAFPELLAGSIVRINPRSAAEALQELNSDISKRLFLVEHSKGLVCCHIRCDGNGDIPVLGATFTSKPPTGLAVQD